MQSCEFQLLIAGIAEAERDVHHHLDIHRYTGTRARAEFPAGQRFHRVLVKLGIELPHELNAVYRAVFADNCVENYFAIHMLLDD